VADRPPEVILGGNCKNRAVLERGAEEKNDQKGEDWAPITGEGVDLSSNQKGLLLKSYKVNGRQPHRGRCGSLKGKNPKILKQKKRRGIRGGGGGGGGGGCISSGRHKKTTYPRRGLPLKKDRGKKGCSRCVGGPRGRANGARCGRGK